MTATATATATATIEPKGRRDKKPRDHLITLRLNVSPIDPQHSDAAYIGGIARRAFDGFAPVGHEPDRRHFDEISVPTKNSRTVVAIEGTVMCAGRPADEAIEVMRATLIAESYYVTIRERRECSQEGCLTDIVVEWNRAAVVPSRWYSNEICDKHDFKTCHKCKSIFAMTSVNASGQAPSLHCEVCGTVLVEWGGSKIWTAERVMSTS